jgi:hypothetical protein
VPTRRLQDFGEDLRVRTTLSEIVAARPEVADDARDAPRERRECLAARILRDVTVDAKMEVGVHRTREYEFACSVHDLVSVACREALPYHRDTSVLDAHVRPDGALSRQNGLPAKNDGIESTHRHPFPRSTYRASPT